MEIREVRQEDLQRLLELYTQLHDNPMPFFDDKLESLWNNILTNPDHHIIIGIEDDRIVSSCVIVIISNLTNHQRPYAFIENVITDEKSRGKGYATMLLGFAKEIARKENCYKIMLMTGSKKESTLQFYENAGYNHSDKTAFIQWLK